MISAIRISANGGGWEISQNGAYTSPISATVSSGNTATVEFTLQAEEEYTDVDLAVKTRQSDGTYVSGCAFLEISDDGTNWSSSLANYTIDDTPTTFYARLTGPVTAGTVSTGAIEVTSTKDSDNYTQYFDARVSVPLSAMDYSNLNIGLNHAALSDSYSMTVPAGTADLDDKITGSLFNWNYDFAVDAVSENAGMVNYTGRYDVNKLRYTYYTVVRRVYFSGDNAPSKVGISAQGLISDIASQLGLTLSYQAMDWSFPLPLQNTDGHYGIYVLRGTYRNIISQLFGWLSEMPNMDFYVSIRNGVLYVVQRGREQSSYTIQKVQYPPTVNRQRIHTEWSGTAPSKTQNDYENETPKVPFTGVISYGNASLTYEDGLLMQEVSGNVTTTYTYTDIQKQKYLDSKETISVDPDTGEGTCSKTLYYYTSINTDEIYLYEETEYTDGTYDGLNTDYTDAEIRRTTHTPIGNGWYGHTTYNSDNEVEATSISQGAPGNTVTPYMVEAVQSALRGTAQAIIDLLLMFLNPPLIETNWPVMDRNTTVALIRNCDALNGKIEETVSLATPDAHIIDMSQTVVYNSNTYYVESNNIVHDAETGIMQNLVLKRWY